MAIKIISRQEWGARAPKSTPIKISIPTKELWLHHAAGAVLPGDDTVSDADLRRIRSIQKYHMDVRGWNDIAYSFLMDPDGNIFEGRGVGISGAHTAGHNSISHALCVMGNYETQPVDSDLIPRLAEFALHGFQQNWWPLGFTGGHRDASGANTSCPGKNLYAQLGEINKQIKEGNDMAFSQHEESVLKQFVASLDAVSSNGSFAAQAVQDIRQKNDADANHGGYARRDELGSGSLPKEEIVKIVRS